MDRPRFLREDFIAYLHIQPTDKYYDRASDYDNPISSWIRKDYKLRVKTNRWGLYLDGQRFNQSTWIKQFLDEMYDNISSGMITPQMCLEILYEIKLNRNQRREDDKTLGYRNI